MIFPISMNLDFFMAFHEDSNPLATFTKTSKRGFFGVYILADQVQKVETGCAYGVALDDPDAVILTAKAIEGVPTNTLFGYGTSNAQLFRRTESTVIREPIHFFRLSLLAIRVNHIVETTW